MAFELLLLGSGILVMMIAGFWGYWQNTVSVAVPGLWGGLAMQFSGAVIKTMGSEDAGAWVTTIGAGIVATAVLAVSVRLLRKLER